MAILNNQRVHCLAYHGSSIPIGASWKRSFWCTWMVTSPGRSEAPWNFRWKTLNIWTCSGKSVKTILFWKGLILVFKRLMIQKLDDLGLQWGKWWVLNLSRLCTSFVHPGTSLQRVGPGIGYEPFLKVSWNPHLWASKLDETRQSNIRKLVFRPVVDKHW